MPPKRERTTSAECKSEPDSEPRTPKKPKTTPKKHTKVAKVAKVKTEPDGKKMGPWSGDELLRLYAVMCPKRTGTDWSEVAAAVGERDAKSCQNKWSRIQGKIMEAIASLGE